MPERLSRPTTPDKSAHVLQAPSQITDPSPAPRTGSSARGGARATRERHRISTQQRFPQGQAAAEAIAAGAEATQEIKVRPHFPRARRARKTAHSMAASIGPVQAIGYACRISDARCRTVDSLPGQAVATILKRSHRISTKRGHRVDAYENHVNLGFNRGASLPDAKRLLEGTGKNIRHVRIASPQDLKLPLSTYIRAAPQSGKHKIPAPVSSHTVG